MTKRNRRGDAALTLVEICGRMTLRNILPAIIVCWLAAATPASAGVVISVDTFSQEMTVSVDGALRYTWPVSTGRQGYATPAGSYHPLRMEREHYSREWDMAPMPYSIFFTQYGHAIHGTQSTAKLGSPVSHGCVRLAPDNAAELFSLVEKRGLADTEVDIVGIDSYVPPSVVGGRQDQLDFDKFIRLLDGG